MAGHGGIDSPPCLPMADAQDRNLPASEKKIRKARADGQVARSRDLSHLAVVGAGGALLVVLAPRLGDWLARILGAGLRFDAQMLAQPGVLTQRLAELGWAWLWVLLPLGGASISLALGAALAAGGWNFTLKPLAPNFGKLDHWPAWAAWCRASTWVIWSRPVVWL